MKLLLIGFLFLASNSLFASNLLEITSQTIYTGKNHEVKISLKGSDENINDIDCVIYTLPNQDVEKVCSLGDSNSPFSIIISSLDDQPKTEGQVPSGYFLGTTIILKKDSTMETISSQLVNINFRKTHPYTPTLETIYNGNPKISNVRSNGGKMVMGLVYNASAYFSEDYAKIMNDIVSIKVEIQPADSGNHEETIIYKSDEMDLSLFTHEPILKNGDIKIYNSLEPHYFLNPITLLFKAEAGVFYTRIKNKYDINTTWFYIEIIFADGSSSKSRHKLTTPKFDSYKRKI